MNNPLLRHMVATTAYRLEKVCDHAPPLFGTFTVGLKTRNPQAIVNHMAHVIRATRVFLAEERSDSTDWDARPWDEELARFTEELGLLDGVLAEKEFSMESSKRLIQGPLSDVLTHVGQLAMLCGLAGAPIPAEDYSAASVQTGVVTD